MGVLFKNGLLLALTLDILGSSARFVYFSLICQAYDLSMALIFLIFEQ